MHNQCFIKNIFLHRFITNTLAVGEFYLFMLYNFDQDCETRRPKDLFLYKSINISQTFSKCYMVYLYSSLIDMFLTKIIKKAHINWKVIWDTVIYSQLLKYEGNFTLIRIVEKLKETNKKCFIFCWNLKERENIEMNALCITFTNPVISFTKKGASDKQDKTWGWFMSLMSRSILSEQECH